MNYRKQWQDQGYLVVRGAFDATRISRLHEVCETAFGQWRRESSRESEPGGNFGNYYGPKGWIMVHLNHPKYHRADPASLPCLLDAIAEPLGQTILRDLFQEEPLFAQANYYFDPPGETRIGDWHRDCQFFCPNDEDAERRSVVEEADPPRELHMHIPLVATAASELVPGSHRRWDTPEERRIRLHEPLCESMPGAKRLHLEPGDLAFFHVNTIHRGLYYQGVPRRTIAVTFSRKSQVRKATAELMKAWNGYVCTYQPWALKTGYLDGASDSTRELFGRFIETYRDSWKPEYLVPELGPLRQAYFTNY